MAFPEPERPSSIVSLDARRRQKQAEAKKRAKQKPPGHERAINWKRVPLFVGVVILFLVASWLINVVAAHLNPFH